VNALLCDVISLGSLLVAPTSMNAYVPSTLPSLQEIAAMRRNESFSRFFRRNILRFPGRVPDRRADRGVLATN
jgi:hypothetical protein